MPRKGDTVQPIHHIIKRGDEYGHDIIIHCFVRCCREFEGYINSSEQELAFRRENMRSTAEQIAQETQLRHICQENQDDCAETA